jgi:RNA polymerase sigma factor (sigma-70 family)
MVRAVLLDQSSIEDVLQEAFTRVLQSRKSFSSRQEAFHYLRKTVLTTTIDMYRRSSRQMNKVSGYRNISEVPVEAVQERPDPLNVLILQEQEEKQRQLVKQVKSALKSLPPTQQQAIELFFSRSRSRRLKDICRESGIPYSTLRSRVLRGVDSIRLRLREKGVQVLQVGKEVTKR